MPPVGKPLKNDGPACRVCGCTEHNACLTTIFQRPPRNHMRTVVPCSWAKVEGASPPLCSACSGTTGDLAEALARGRRHLNQHGLDGFPFLLKINDAALARYRARLKLST